MESKIFVRNRVLGYVSNSVPLKSRYIKKRKENVIVTCVGKSFYSWGSTHLSLLSISPQHDAEIHCLEGDTFMIFTASGNIVQAWRRGVELKHTYRNNSQTRVHLLLPFGPHLLGVDESNVLSVWDIANEDIYLELNFGADSFQVSALCHPHTYVNKILFGSKQGALQLWNLNSSKLIYSFVGWHSAVTVLAPSPALDVVGVGLQSGKIVLHNIKFDETLMTFVQDWGPVTRLTFCTDNAPILASGSDLGHIVIWHLEQRKVVSQLLNAHDEPVCGLEFLPAEQLIVSSSSDNSLKMWHFDAARGGAHLLRLRQGHKAPPSVIRFYGPLGNFILSGGCDGYLQAFNTETERANVCLGRALKQSAKRALKKEPQDEEGITEAASKVLPIAYFSAEPTRDKEWDSIAAVHPGKGFVSTWSLHASKFGKFVGRRSQKVTNVVTKKITASSVFVTHCGNFVVVGYSSGTVDKFNMQSGASKGTFGQQRAHKGCVTGLFVNNVNHFMVSGGTDGCLKFWAFQAHRRPPFHRLQLGDAVTMVRSHDESSLLAVGLQNYAVLIVDADCRAVIRRFDGHRAELTDLAYSPDCRWLVSASMDATLRTWDIPSGRCVDSIRVERPCVSVAFHPTGACLATAHVDCVGVTLWSNRCLFSLVSLEAAKPRRLKAGCDVSLADSLITYSPEVAISHSWQNILSVETIRERNRLREPPKVAVEAPFVLPVIPALNIKFDLSDATKEQERHDRFLSPGKVASGTPFAKMLAAAKREQDLEAAIEKLKGMSLLAVTFEISSLSPEHGGSATHLLQFVEMLKVMFKSRRCFEIACSFLAQFLKSHMSLCMSEEDLFAAVESLSEVHDECWSHLENKLLYSMSVSKFFMDS